LEEDLGVGAGALREILAALRERFGVSLEWDLARQRGSTISNLVDALSRQLSQGSGLAGGGAGRLNGKGGLDKIETGPARSSESFAALQPALKPFAGKIAFVSGSGRGLGKEIAVYLAQLGATVVVNSFHSRPKGEETVRQIQAAGGEAIHLWGSMANPAHMDQLFDGIEQRYGGIDFFISSASNGMLARLKDITAEDWEKAFRTNVVGLHQGAMRSAQLMRKRGGGKIITMSSPAAHGYVDYFGCMGAVKAAVESLTRSLAIELATDNIQVNCISPGPVYGDLLNKWPESERLVKQWERNTAYGRLCKADEVAHFVAYMLSDAVKLFTGSVLVMDGGISAQGW
jgi:NAD(P)-dependent dehydrogenase (short-subunit alcohol dehydrogenase family)